MSKVPTRIFCPACGQPLRTEEITDSKDLLIIRNSGFIASAKFLCRCGVVGMINVRPMPESPTWTITFDKYQLSGKESSSSALPRRGEKYA